MRKVTGLLAVLGALVIALPVMAQSPGGTSAAPASNPNQPQVPQPAQGGVNWQGVGIGAGTVVGNLFYVPAKVVYGVLGGITGGASYLLTGGNTQTADTIWRSSLGGDYVLTPDMVAGQKPIHFSGPTSTAPIPGQQAPGASGGASAAAPRTASAAPSATTLAANPPPVTSASVGGAAISGTGTTTGLGAATSAKPQPADSGSGPVGAGASAPPLPATTIE
jgi:hypothetical protein